MPRIRQVIATKSFHPRAIEPETLVDLAHQFARPAVIVSDVAEALEEALRITDDHSLVLVAGSLFVAAGARETWYKENLRVSGETHF
jgi:dihydrofolate synthase/folylpolyglutamate synthase